MRVANFTAVSDLVGRRVRISWDFIPENTETLADAPTVRLRRKLRDFDFPPPAPGDPYLIYDSTDFPPVPSGTVQVLDLPEWEVEEDIGHTVYSAVSIAGPVGNRFVEVLRRTVGTTFDTRGVAVRQRVEIVEVGGTPGALQPGVSYYYELSGVSAPLPPVDDPAVYRATVSPTDSFGTNRTLYEMLPSVFRRHDVVTRPITPGTDTIPEASPRSGQLRRLMDLFGTGFDSLRGTAESLRNLHDVDGVDARFLPLLAKWIGWDLSFNAGVPLQRNEIKSASRLFRTVGTIPGLRAIVSQYTGWFTQVAEFVQQITRANDAPWYNVFAAAEVGSSWIGVDDATTVLGFIAGNTDAAGSGSLPATLTGSAVEPFALIPGMALSLAVDGLLPVGVRFEAEDFADVGAATAAEVAAVINRVFHELTASVSAGQLVLTSNSVGPQSTIHVEERGASLVTLEGAPGGRLAAFRDAQGRSRLFYETTDMPAEVKAARRIRYKTLVDGAWRGSRPVIPTPVVAQGSPSALVLPAGPMVLGWIDEPHTTRSRLRVAAGRSRPAQPARLFGRRREPFALTAGATMRITGDFVGADLFTVNPADYFDILHATTAELVAAMSAQLTHVSVTAVNGALRIDSASTGPRARLAVDLAQSTTARTLGFGPENATGVGSWDDEIDWDPPQSIPPVPTGRHDDLVGIADPLGGGRIFWSRHRVAGGIPRWRLTEARWDGNTWVATDGGVGVRSIMGTWSSLTTAAGLASNDVRGVALDADGGAWFATAAGVTVRRPNGSWITFTVADGLASNDVRAVALALDGSAAFATAAGVSFLSPTGVWTTYTIADGLASNDVRALAFDADGTAWFATAAGVSSLTEEGAWRSLVPPLFPVSDVLSVKIDPQGLPWFATALGAVAWDGAAARLVSETAAGDHARDVAVAEDGTLWVATSTGVKMRATDGAWQTFSTASGLPSNDAHGVTIAPDGTVQVATPSGVGVRGTDEVWRTWNTSSGLVANNARMIQGPWSALLELSSLADDNGGDRQPTAVVDGTNRIWVIWSQRREIGTTDDTWLLRWRRFDPATGWTPEGEVTTTPGGVHAADREPAAILDPGGGGVRVFFHSDRSGGPRLWWLPLSLTGVAGAPVALLDNEADDRAPVPLFPVVGPKPTMWLLFRSDRNVPLGQVSAGETGSIRIPDEGSIRRYAGTTTVVLDDIVRTRRRRQWGDLIAYTPQKVAGALDPPLTEEDRYTRGTIGLFVSRGRLGNPLTVQEVARMRQLLSSFLPINVRAVLILAPSLDIEILYPPGADIGESYSDSYPFVEYLTTLGDSTAAALPDWSFLLSNTAGHVSADPSNLLTLRHRSFYEPPE